MFNMGTPDPGPLEAKGAKPDETAGGTLSEAHQRYQLLVDLSPDAICVHQDDVLVYVNQFMVRLLGAESPESLIGRSVYHILHPVSHGVARHRIIVMKATGTTMPPVVQRWITADGQSLYIEVNAAACLWNGKRAVQVVGRDISGRVQTEKRLQDSELRFYAFMDHCPFSAWIADSNDVIVYCNRAYAACFHKSPPELLGLKAHELFAKLQIKAIPVLEGEQLPADKIQEHVQKVTLADGKVHRFRSYRFAISAADGESLIGGIAIDVTEQERLQTKLREAHKMESIGRLAGGVAHDFNNLLTVIMGYAEVVDESLPLGDDRHTSMRNIQTAAGRAANLTRQLLAFARKQPILPRLIDPDQCLREMDTILLPVLGENIALELDIKEGAHTAWVDPAQLEQVILNLAANARDAMPAGGTLTVSTRCETVNVALTRQNADVPAGDYTVITVSDNGLGMDEKIRARVFEPFFTTKEQGKGTGLGLATCYGIVKQSQGYIFADSVPGVGTEFTIFLPAREVKRYAAGRTRLPIL